MAGASADQAPIVGLIALDRDAVIEKDLHTLCEPSATVVTTRIPLARVGSVEHLVALADFVPGATRVLAASRPSVIAFGCTSAVALIGSDRVRRQVHLSLSGVPVVDPLTGMARGLRRLAVRTISLITPYPLAISGRLASWFEAEDYEVVENVRIEGDYASYAEVPRSAIEHAAELGAASGAEGLVIACTDLRAVDSIEDLEKRFGVPVVTSNQALAWSAGMVMGVPTAQVGRLMSPPGL